MMWSWRKVLRSIGTFVFLMRVLALMALVVLVGTFLSEMVVILPAYYTSDSLFQNGLTQMAKQAVQIGTLASLAAILAFTARLTLSMSTPKIVGFHAFTYALHFLNAFPFFISTVVACFIQAKSDCKPGEHQCSRLLLACDVVGLVSARLARLDLVACLLFASRGMTWIYCGTNGSLGYAEAMPVHRAAGAWCAAMSFSHSVAYMAFYLFQDGELGHAFKYDLLPISREGLVNFFGISAAVVLLPMLVLASPMVRRTAYHAFQIAHVPLSLLFVVLCALHDLPILLFATPGLVEWLLGRSSSTSPSLAKAKIIEGTSGPWVEITIEHNQKYNRYGSMLAPRGEWVSLRILPLGREMHPLSLTASDCSDDDHNDNKFTAIISAKAGDWSRRLAHLARTDLAHDGFQVEVDGPYPFGGGWALQHESTATLLIAGGTGVTGWLPILNAIRSNHRATSKEYCYANMKCHLVWCVHDEADYRALAKRLPPLVAVTVFVTQSADVAMPTSSDIRIDAENAYDGVEGAQTTATDSPRTDNIDAGMNVVALVSLVTTLVGLLTVYYSEKYAYSARTSARSLLEYAINGRLVPILFFLACMAVLSVSGKRAALICAELIERGQRKVDGSVSSEDHSELPILHSRLSSLLTLPSTTMTRTHHGPSESLGSVIIRLGRPNIDELIHDAASSLDMHKRLIIAACGPPALVTSVQAGVAKAKRECNHRYGAHIQFCGSDSIW